MDSVEYSRELVAHRTGPISRIVFSSPETFNAFTIDNMSVIRNAFASESNHADIKVVVFSSGVAKYFCTGGATSLLMQLINSTVSERGEILSKAQAITKAVISAPALVVAEHDGLAAGAGADLLLACDKIVSSTRAKFNVMFSKLNLVPDLGGLFLLAERVGRARALDMYVESRNLSGSDLLQLGVVDKVVDDFSNADWHAILASYLERPKSAIAAAKHCIMENIQARYLRHLAVVNEHMSELLSSSECEKAVNRLRGMQRVVTTVENAGS